MGNPGVAIFLIFFGVSLLDALRGGHWARAALWIAVGVLFWALDRVGLEHRGKSKHGRS